MQINAKGLIISKIENNKNESDMQRFSKKQQFIRKKRLLGVSSIQMETSALKNCQSSNLTIK